MKQKPLILWLIAITITLSAVIYQRMTGPSNPKRITIHASDGSTLSFRLPRSQNVMKEARINITVPDPFIVGTLYYKRYPVRENWTKLPMKRDGEILSACLPNQIPAGKLEYYIILDKKGNQIRLPQKESVIIRFRGDVPAAVIIPHALLMFIGMFLSNVAALMVLAHNKRYRFFTFLTTAVFLAGGMILGPIVQKYAFGAYWTGFPYGFDLTDNKTLIAFVCWVAASAGNLTKERRWLTIIAAVTTLLIFSIPHSAKGSELDYETGKVKTGMLYMRPEGKGTT